MIKLIILFFAIVPLISQTNTDIYLFDLKISEDEILITNPENITNRKGYDNQPFFHSKKPLIYYSSFNDSNKSDIKVYNIDTKTTKFITNTKEREYSPTVTLDNKYISCIIQRDNGEQNLGKYPISGGEPIILIKNLIVGYHTWLNNHQLLLFVLGEPHKLVLYSLRNNTSEIIAEDIGRSLHKIPNSNNGSFIQKSSDEWSIKKYDINTNEIQLLCSTLEGREDIAWASENIILSSDGEGVYYYNIKKKNGWQKIKLNFNTNFMKGITRIVINSDNSKIAIVVADSESK